MPSDPPQPPPQPTESEAIVAASRDAEFPGTPLADPVPLPVEVAASLPATSSVPFGSRDSQEERREPGVERPPSLLVRRKDDRVGGED
jgi:hypothetical protein